jgi:hypothetical protein
MHLCESEAIFLQKSWGTCNQHVYKHGTTVVANTCIRDGRLCMQCK